MNIHLQRGEGERKSGKLLRIHFVCTFMAAEMILSCARRKTESI